MMLHTLIIDQQITLLKINNGAHYLLGWVAGAWRSDDE